MFTEEFIIRKAASASSVLLDFSWETERLIQFKRHYASLIRDVTMWCKMRSEATSQISAFMIPIRTSASTQSKQGRRNQLPHRFTLPLIMKPFRCFGEGNLESVALWLCLTDIQYLYSPLSSTWLIIHIPQEARTSPRRIEAYTFSLSPQTPCLTFSTWSLIVTPVASDRVHQIL